MEALARWAGYLAIAGGAVMTVVVVITMVDTSSPAWVGFFVVPILLGAAVLGFEFFTRTATGQLGRWSAWLSAAGALGLIVVFAWSTVSGEGTSGNYNAATDPLVPFWAVTAGAWFLGNLGYAVALIRGKALSTIGAWLVLAGAVVGIAITATLTQNPQPLVYLLFAVFGIGWIVIGYAALQPQYRSAP